jgi:hypothetical protein
LAKFDMEQAVAYASVQQLINEWGRDLDLHNGANISGLVTEDVRYTMGPNVLEGRAAVAKFYGDRLARLTASPSGVPTARHLNANLCLDFLSASQVSITFSLMFFTTEAPSGTQPDPVAVADVRMQCRRDADGDWRINQFDSNQPFRRG